MRKAKALSVDFRSNFHDAKVKLMKKQGFTVRAIARATGLTESQVSYRIWKGNLSIPLAFRQGMSKAAREAIQRIDKILEHLRVIKKMRAA